MLEIHSKISYILIQKLTFHLGLKIYLLPIYANWYICSAKCVQLNKYKLNTITKFQASHKNIKFVSQISILKSCILYLPNTKGNFFRDPESIHEFKLFPSKKPGFWSAKPSHSTNQGLGFWRGRQLKFISWLRCQKKLTLTFQTESFLPLLS